MTVREFLERGLALDKLVKARLEQIQYLRDRQTDVSVTLSHTGGIKGGQSDRLGYITAEIIDQTDKYARKIVELLMVKREIKEAIDSVGRNDYRLLLSLRYESFMTWEEVADEMKYSYYHVVQRMHSNALRAISKDVIECYTLDEV